MGSLAAFGVWYTAAGRARPCPLSGSSATNMPGSWFPALARSVSLRAEGGRPWAVMGDFNATVEEPALQLLLAAGHQDALGHLPPRGPGAGTEHGFTGATDRRRIDYILVGRGTQVTSAQIVHARPGGRLPSDHWPVVARVER